MSFGITTSLSGVKAREIELDVLANNLANMQTTGFKEMSMTFESELDQAAGTSDLSSSYVTVKQGRTQVNMMQGTLMNTGNPLDVAIQGEGFFSVQTAAGVRYTRDGQFTRDASGTLVTMRGEPVLTNNGPLTLPQDKQVHIDQQGNIYVGPDEQVGQLLVSSFDDIHKLRPEGRNQFSAEGLTPTTATTYQIAQHNLENSNVNMVGNLTRLIQVSRAYESLQKSISQQLEARKMLNQLAQIS